ncbi:MAG: thiamine-phosphate kinase [Bacteroidales bacterium]|nr:thiamine-phosphate kinase [Bacteroidales bacterium]
MDKNQQKKNIRTEISSIGEFPLIEHLTKNIQLKHQSSVKGVGDDAAVMAFGEDAAVLTKDLLIEGVHFDLTYTPLKHLGYKAVAVNISDLAAMNAIPRQLLIGIGVSNRFSVEALEEIYEGINLACKFYDVDLTGGDTVASKSGLFISVTAIGQAKREEIIYRNTAQTGDLIFVSGDLGAAYMGLLLLEREKKVFTENPDIQPDLEGHDYVLHRQLKPEARTDVNSLLKDQNVKPTSMIDISDGLASEIIHICKASGKGCNIYDEKIPLDPATVSIAEEFGINPITCALNGGEDYELLFTISQDDYEKIKGIAGLSVVGHITDESEGMHLITSDNHAIPLTAQGWDAFLNKNPASFEEPE